MVGSSIAAAYTHFYINAKLLFISDNMIIGYFQTIMIDTQSSPCRRHCSFRSSQLAKKMKMTYGKVSLFSRSSLLTAHTVLIMLTVLYLFSQDWEREAECVCCFFCFLYSCSSIAYMFFHSRLSFGESFIANHVIVFSVIISSYLLTF